MTATGAGAREGEVVPTLEEIANAVPDDIDLFRILRAAGRSDESKAKAVRASLEGIERAILAHANPQPDGGNG